MSTCKKCGEEIVWVKTLAGKNMPCDPDEETFNLIEGRVVVTPEGHVLRGTKDTHNVLVQGYIPHWSTCPFADDFRKKEAPHV